MQTNCWFMAIKMLITNVSVISRIHEFTWQERFLRHGKTECAHCTWTKASHNGIINGLLLHARHASNCTAGKRNTASSHIVMSVDAARVRCAVSVQVAVTTATCHFIGRATVRAHSISRLRLKFNERVIVDSKFRLCSDNRSVIYFQLAVKKIIVICIFFFFSFQSIPRHCKADVTGVDNFVGSIVEKIV